MEIKGRHIIDFVVLIVLTSIITYFITAYLIPKEFTRPTYTIIMNDSGGLIEGSAVLLFGKQVGHVANLKHTDDGVKIRFVIDNKEVKQLPPKCEVAIKSSGIGGSKSLDIYQNKNLKKDEIKVRDTINQTELSNVQLIVLKDTINAGNAISVELPPDKLFEVKSFMKYKLVTTSYETILDNVIKYETNLQNKLNKKNNDLKKLNNNLEKFNDNKHSTKQ